MSRPPRSAHLAELVTQLRADPRHHSIHNPLAALQWMGERLRERITGELDVAPEQHRRLVCERSLASDELRDALERLGRDAHRLCGRAGMPPGAANEYLDPVLQAILELIGWQTVADPGVPDCELDTPHMARDLSMKLKNTYANEAFHDRYLPKMYYPAMGRLTELILNLEGSHPALLSPTNSPADETGKAKGDAAGRRAAGRGGRPKLGQRASASEQERAKLNAYQLIREALQPGWGPQSLLSHFKNYKDFKELVKRAGRKCDEAFMRAAMKWIADNNKI